MTFREEFSSGRCREWARPLLRGSLLRGSQPEEGAARGACRYEVRASPGIEGIGIIDVLGGYPRAEDRDRKTHARRQVIICDEIADRDDAEAILQAHNSGICVAASAHIVRSAAMTEEPLRVFSAREFSERTTDFSRRTKAVLSPMLEE